ncbi:hypothetical protein pipiens_015225 [Culex pipiens pipiens]|uniref:CARMIL C-terminal domain-containing protein n=1 Tax=Culex pipiens pipiens TaxID=38569 RepID=A0ABD1CRE1_CULPP
MNYANSIQTPETPRSRSSQGSDHLAQFDTTGLDLPKLGLDSPTKLEYLNLATPQLQTKRRSLARKVRPQSVVGLGIENLSLTNIPDCAEKHSPEENSIANSTKESSIWSAKKIECDSITELPSQSLTLQHLVKSRPKRAKTHTSKKIKGPKYEEFAELYPGHWRGGLVRGVSDEARYDPADLLRNYCDVDHTMTRERIGRSGRDHFNFERDGHGPPFDADVAALSPFVLPVVQHANIFCRRNLAKVENNTDLAALNSAIHDLTALTRYARRNPGLIEFMIDKNMETQRAAREASRVDIPVSDMHDLRERTPNVTEQLNRLRHPDYETVY